MKCTSAVNFPIDIDLLSPYKQWAVNGSPLFWQPRINFLLQRTPANSCLTLEGWKQNGSKCYWIKKQIKPSNDCGSNFEVNKKKKNSKVTRNETLHYRLLDSLVASSAGFECGRSQVQSPVKDRVIPKTL